VIVDIKRREIIHFQALARRVREHPENRQVFEADIDYSMLAGKYKMAATALFDRFNIEHGEIESMSVIAATIDIEVKP
jgi:hypothetical protein